MKKAFLVLTAILITSSGYAQEITKDGFGPLHWGATVAEAEKAFPDSKKKVPDYGDAYNSRWMFQNDIPCDLLLLPKPGKENPSIALYFYNGKFVALVSTYRSKQVPGGGVGKSLDDDLRQRIHKALGDADTIVVHILISYPGMDNVPMLQGGMQNLRITLKMTNKQLVSAAKEDIQSRLEKCKDELREGVPTALLNP